MIAVYVLVTASAVLSTVFVLALFFWAARKDEEADRAARAQRGERR